MNKKINKVFMAFAKGNESTEGTPIKKYIGVAPVFVLNVNPSKSELEALYGGITLQNEPEYVGVSEVGSDENRKTVPQVRIDFIVKTDAEKCEGIEMVNKVSFFLKQEYRFNRDQSKVQIIDKYGRTAWVTKEELKTKTIPQYSNGPANIDPDYRPAYIGEEDLTEFIKAYLNIPNPQNYINGQWVDKSPTEKAEAEARLDKIVDYFKGDVKELKSLLSYQPNNKVKVLFGVKTTDDNRQYQSVYTQRFLKNNVNDYSRLDKEVKERKDAGGYSDTEFVVGPLKEYGVEATSFTNTDGGPAPDPFANASSPWGD